MKCAAWPVSICSWSLHTDIAGVAAAMRELGIDQVNLALKPAIQGGGDAYLEAVREQPWTISAATIGFPQEDYTSLESIEATGGIVPDAFWPENRRRVERAVEITASLGVKYLTMHAGFLASEEPSLARRVRERLVCLADAAAAREIQLLLETGQEAPRCLRGLLEELRHPALGVNFDPANVILYGQGDPLEAATILAPWIRHVHVKDAEASAKPGVWGAEAPWGEGQVGGDKFLDLLKSIQYSGALAIEREAGNDRLGDIRLATQRLAGYARRTCSSEQPGECA